MASHYPLLLTLTLKISIFALLFLAAMHDIATRTVPNWMALMLAIPSVVLAVMDHRFFWGLGFGLAVFALCIVFWQRGWMGGADVKLIGAAAIAIAPAAAGAFLAAVTMSGGLLAIAYLTARTIVPRPGAHRPRRLLPRILRVEAWRIRNHGPLPYACAIATGTIFVLS